MRKIRKWYIKNFDLVNISLAIISIFLVGWDCVLCQLNYTSGLLSRTTLTLGLSFMIILQPWGEDEKI